MAFAHGCRSKISNKCLVYFLCMAYDETLAEEIRSVLPRGQVVEKRMFGGLGFILNGNMCVSVNNRPDHVMMVRIDPKNQEALTKKGATTAIMRGRAMPGWIFLTKDAIATEEDFMYWIRLALDFNKALPGKKK